MSYAFRETIERNIHYRSDPKYTFSVSLHRTQTLSSLVQVFRDGWLRESRVTNLIAIYSLRSFIQLQSRSEIRQMSIFVTCPRPYQPDTYSVPARRPSRCQPQGDLVTLEWCTTSGWKRDLIWRGRSR
jgi:hypothetical protein